MFIVIYLIKLHIINYTLVNGKIKDNKIRSTRFDQMVIRRSWTIGNHHRKKFLTVVRSKI